MGNALSKKDIQSLLKKKILDRWSISLEVLLCLSHRTNRMLFIAFTNFKRLCFI